ncbi:SDR family NAD(P)-dependent oxidoreductase [Bacillus gobiensis]|uniref:SDR family NAD(P)-dependent oxidoreductase n=1 Tax=Bacillus gobiensis TaxID=1441095 RepID=UPI003D1D69A9
MQSVVVTGVSSGIGWGTAKILIEKGFHVFGSVRKSEDADRLSAEWGEAFTPLFFDVTDEEAVQRGAAVVRGRLQGRTLFGLVNNAGIAGPAPLIHQPISDYRRQIEVNLIGPLIVTQAFAELLGADDQLSGAPGRIVNISSIGGKIAGPFLGAYHASKFGIEGFSESLRRELMIHGIDVIVIGPGSVATAIWDKAEQDDFSSYQNTEYVSAMETFRQYMIENGKKGYTAERLGEIVWKALTTSNPPVRYGYKAVQRPISNWVIPRLLPKRIVDMFLANNLGLKRKSKEENAHYKKAQNKEV